MIKKIIENIEMHEQYMNNTINLIASENKMSYLARKALVSDYGNRVAEGWIDNRLFPGIKYYNEIEEFGMELIKEMFDADFVDLRPISGTMANMVVYAALTNYGDTILAPAIRDGGHISMSGATPKRVFNLNVINIPMIEDNYIKNNKKIFLDVKSNGLQYINIFPHVKQIFSNALDESQEVLKNILVYYISLMLTNK